MPTIKQVHGMISRLSRGGGFHSVTAFWCRK